MQKSIQEIAEAVGGVVVGDGDIIIEGVAGLEDAEGGDIIFVEHRRFAKAAAASPATAVLAPPQIVVDGKPTIQVPDPRVAFARVMRLFQEPEPLPRGVAPTARFGTGVSLGEGAAVGEYCVLGNNVSLGEGAVLFPFVCLGDNVSVGAGTVIFSHVSVYHDVAIGARVRIHSGTVIGADGFGYVHIDGHHEKIPQMGRVVIEDDVEIGAGVCVDRAKTSETRIGRGTKIDNQVQIAHNVRIGRHCILVAQAGIAGSTALGDYVIVAGQAGINGHITVGSGSRIVGQSGVYASVPPGATVSGHPARDHAEDLRIMAAATRLPELQRSVRELRKRIEELEKSLGERDA